MPAAAPPFAASSLAQALIAGEATLPADLSGEQRDALAWALKDAALACWSSNQAQAATIEQVLRQLAATAPDDNGPVAALHDWVAALAAITEGRMADADALLQQAATRLRALGFAAAAAQTQVPRVLVLCMQGKLDEAERCGIVARDELTALGERHAAGRVSLNLGQLACERSDFGAAISHFEAADDGFRHAGDRERAVQASIGLADALAATGRFDAALARYAAAHDEALAGGWPVLAALCDESAALIRLAQGAHGEALAGFERARRQYEALQMPQHLANAERQLADAYLELRLLPEAIALLRHAIARFGELEMNLEAAWARVQLAKALAADKPQDEAISVELAAAEQLFAAESQPAGAATATLARAEHAAATAQHARARELAQSAQAAFAELDMINDAARAALRVAECDAALGQVAAARDALARLLATARELGNATLELRALTALGTLCRQHGERDAARQHLDAAVAIVEQQRHRLDGEQLRHAYFSTALAAYRELLAIALDEQPADSDATGVLLALERFRARALADRLGGALQQPTTGSAALDPLQHRLRWSQRRLQRLHDEGDDATAATAELRQLEDEYLETRRRLQLVGGDASGAASVIDEVALATLREALPAGAAIVEFGVIDDELFACIADSQSVRAVRHVAAWSEVLAAIRRTQFQMDALRSGTRLPAQHLLQLEARVRQALQQLHALVWAPLARQLDAAQRVLVVPHGKLGAISFAALHDGAQYLGERIEIAVVPSVAVAAQVLARRSTAASAPLILADTRRLAHAGAEADALRALHPQAQVYAGDAATAATLREHGPHAACIHLACHGAFRSDNPMFSALELADGNFTALDAETLKLAHPLLVLSACDSGLGSESEGDEVFGLVRAFLVGGAARVVASLWPVDDETTVGWMAAFHRALQTGATPAAAVRAAQQVVRARRPHPFYWAAFAVYGGW